MCRCYVPRFRAAARTSVSPHVAHRTSPADSCIKCHHSLSAVRSSTLRPERRYGDDLGRREPPAGRRSAADMVCRDPGMPVDARFHYSVEDAVEGTTERRGPKTAQGARERRPTGPRRPPVVLRQSLRRILSAHFRRHSDTGRLTAWSTVRDIAHRSASVLRVSDHLALTLARSIRAERARAGLSQAQLAHRLGWSQQVQASIETGGRRLYAHELPDICRALGVPLATLLIGASPEDLEALGV
jgi:ribosome-binding protein aMBF1 (putative translation factor)